MRSRPIFLYPTHLARGLEFFFCDRLDGEALAALDDLHLPQSGVRLQGGQTDVVLEGRFPLDVDGVPAGVFGRRLGIVVAALGIQCRGVGIARTDDLGEARALGRKSRECDPNPYTQYAVWEVLPAERIDALATAWEEGRKETIHAGNRNS